MNCVQNMYITLKFIYNFNTIINLHFCNDPVLLLTLASVHAPHPLTFLKCTYRNLMFTKYHFTINW